MARTKKSEVASFNHIAEELRSLARPIASLRHDPRNAKHHNERNLESIRASLQEHGQMKPIVVRGDVVIAGNGTLECAIALGWTHVAVVEYRGAEKNATRYAIQDNRTAELAEWNDDVLKDLLSELQEEDRALDGLGFSELEVQRLLGEVAPPVVEGSVDPESEWVDLPEFDQPNAMGSRVVVNFKTPADRAAFAKLIGQPMTDRTRSMWYPPAEIYHFKEEAYVDGDE